MKSLEIQNNYDDRRLWVFLGLIILVFGFFIFRLINFQIIQGANYLSRAESNRRSTISLQTQRGIIYDRNGFVLASNIPSYNVVITPADLPSDLGAIQEIYRNLSQLINVPVNKGSTDETTVRLFKPCESDLGIAQVVYIGDTNAPYRSIPIKCFIDRQTAMIIQERLSDLPGIGIEISPIRDYPTGSLTAEIIGFLGPIPAAQEKEYKDLGFDPNRDKVGYAGIEATMQEILSGVNGKRIVEIDAAGKVLRDLEPPKDPQSGSNLRLTIDSRLQSAAKTSLTNELNYWNTYFNKVLSANGVVIAMNPKTGEILSLVSYPTFENNRMARLIPAYYYEQLQSDPYHPLFNHAISAEYSPGSVFKVATAIGALNEKVITPEKELFDPGKITILQKYSPNDPGTPRDYVDWVKEGHGNVNFLKGVANSCDVYFYKIGGGYGEEVPEGLGIWRIGEYARALGYGRLTGIELPGESTGLLPDPNWKRRMVGENWSTGDTYISTIGQGYVLATPLQVLVSVATLANNGKYMKPTLIKDVVDSEGKVVKPFKPEEIWDITRDPLITVYDSNQFATDTKKTVEPWVIQLTKQGLRMVVTEGTAKAQFEGMELPTAGKTGTAEYCDDVAKAQNLCTPGNWPAHAWYVGYAPYDDPEIAVIAFVYNGREGSTVAAPIVRRVIEAYFELKAIDQSSGRTSP